MAGFPDDNWYPLDDGSYRRGDAILVRQGKQWVVKLGKQTYPIDSKKASFTHADRIYSKLRPIPGPTAPPSKGARPVKTDIVAMLKSNRQQAVDFAAKKGVDSTKALLERAQKELNARLRQVSGLSGPGSESFSAAQVRTTLAQIKTVLAGFTPGMEKVVISDGKLTAHVAAEQAIAYIQDADRSFTGIAQRLPIREAAVLDHAVQGAESSILRRLSGDGEKGPGILQRYNEAVIGKFEERLQQRFVQRKPWDDVRNELIADSDFLQAAPASWAERIVRTELMGAHGRAGWEGIREVDKEVGGTMLKILVATFDNRTAADSYAVHGQIRRVDEAFDTWQGSMQHPPARPNDREVVVPHNMDWPILPALAWKSDGEVAARWAQEGRKGSPPSRPKMTTVPLDKIGR